MLMILGTHNLNNIHEIPYLYISIYRTTVIIQKTEKLNNGNKPFSFLIVAWSYTIIITHTYWGMDYHVMK